MIIKRRKKLPGKIVLPEGQIEVIFFHAVQPGRLYKAVEKIASNDELVDIGFTLGCLSVAIDGVDEKKADEIARWLSGGIGGRYKTQVIEATFRRMSARSFPAYYLRYARKVADIVGWNGIHDYSELKDATRGVL